MADIDDPLLALILRFVVAETDSDLPHEACMRLQLALVHRYVDEQLSCAEYVRASPALLQAHKDQPEVTSMRKEALRRPSV